MSGSRRTDAAVAAWTGEPPLLPPRRLALLGGATSPITPTARWLGRRSARDCAGCWRMPRGLSTWSSSTATASWPPTRSDLSWVLGQLAATGTAVVAVSRPSRRFLKVVGNLALADLVAETAR